MNVSNIRPDNEQPSFPMNGKTSSSFVMLTLVCIIVGVGLRLAVILNESAQLTVDRDAYLGIAASIADGRGFSNPGSTTPTAFRPPLYPLLLAAGFKIGSPAFVVAGINLLAGLLTIWATLELGKRLDLGWLRFLAAGLIAVDPLLLQYAARPMTETVCTSLAACWLLSVTRSSSATAASQRKANIAAGIGFGLLVLSRPTFWPLAGICVLVWLISNWRSGTRPDRWNGLSACVAAGVTIAPWVIRNWLLFGIPILTTTHGGYTLLLGNNEVFYNEVVRQPFGTVWPDASQKQWEADLESHLQQELTQPASEPARDAWQSRKAKAFIADHPRETLEAAIHRVRSLWNTFPQGDAAKGVSGWMTFAVSTYYLTVLIAAALGAILVLVRKDVFRWWAICGLIVTVQAVHLLYWTNTRMRAPLTPAIVLLSVVGLSRKQK